MEMNMAEWFHSWQACRGRGRRGNGWGGYCGGDVARGWWRALVLIGRAGFSADCNVAVVEVTVHPFATPDQNTALLFALFINENDARPPPPPIRITCICNITGDHSK